MNRFASVRLFVVLYYDPLNDHLNDQMGIYSMHSVSVAEAKAKLSKIISHVEDGNEVVITRRGRPVARLAAVNKTLKPVNSLAEFRASIPRAKISAAKAIRKMRDEGY